MMAIIEYRLNRYNEPVRTIDTHKVAHQIVEQWANGNDDDPEGLVRLIDNVLKEIVLSLTDA